MGTAIIWYCRTWGWEIKTDLEGLSVQDWIEWFRWRVAQPDGEYRGFFVEWNEHN